MTKKRVALCALAALLLIAAACAEEAPVLGVISRWTPAPTEAPRQDSPEAGPGEATPAEATPAEAEPGARLLLRGMEGEDVRRVQLRLRELGYLWDEADGVYGRKTVKAVADFQRAHGLAKVDGKTGPETAARLFGGDVIPRPTMTPGPTPTPSPSPTPTPTPTPMPRATPVPDPSGAPLKLTEGIVTIGGNPIPLMLGTAGEETLYPLCGVFMHRGYVCTAAGGVWELQGPAGETVTLMASAEDGVVSGAMGALNQTLLLCENPVVVYGNEVWVDAALLRRMGLHVAEAGDVREVW